MICHLLRHLSSHLQEVGSIIGKVGQFHNHRLMLNDAYSQIVLFSSLYTTYCYIISSRKEKQ